MMFEILDTKIISTDLPVITSNYVVLHYDELPILFTGTNKYGDHIVGSIMCEDEDLDIFRYLYLIVNKNDYDLFINRNITYRALIEKQNNVFILDKDFDDSVIMTYNVLPSDIPTDFLPHPTKSICPVTAL